MCEPAQNSINLSPNLMSHAFATDPCPHVYVGIEKANYVLQFLWENRIIFYLADHVIVSHPEPSDMAVLHFKSFWIKFLPDAWKGSRL